ncbi:MAG: 2-C-methyl-D-erythritol 2,4-cyclodiphosphate synthase [Acidobacteriaceae bacterium]|nr:2-C-methyl-D-erythritol 2,4-cyclodiphosphate synthase [Acidobacteriaceae bacterium]MBV9780775.1 2-C-methyl-D-erythritol 2,4-cyclodiphosphate synthase [Acidobacteriaceae bacterium]
MTETALPRFRVGHGWDTHRIEPGRPLILAGVNIPSEFGLAGHSDADVLFHAVTDAILGALALGDIGMHFPDTSAEWKNVPSVRFLQKALLLASKNGYWLENVDSTVILERPKLKDFRAAIRDNLAQALSLPADRVSVKFKTAEKVGPVGEGRSCEAYAVVLLSTRSDPEKQSYMHSD